MNKKTPITSSKLTKNIQILKFPISSILFIVTKTPIAVIIVLRTILVKLGS